MGRILFWLLWFFGVLVDQGTKWWAEKTLEEQVVPLVPSILELRLRRNFASAFGLQFLNQPQHFVLTIGVTLFFLIFLFWRKRSETLLLYLGSALYLAGAWGNLLDRLWRGYVVDFIEPSFWATFNVADVLIVSGVLVIIWSFLRHEKGKNSRL